MVNNFFAHFIKEIDIKRYVDNVRILPINNTVDVYIQIFGHNAETYICLRIYEKDLTKHCESLLGILSSEGQTSFSYN